MSVYVARPGSIAAARTTALPAITDSFTRADGNLHGSVTEIGGLTWTRISSAPWTGTAVIYSNTVRESVNPTNCITVVDTGYCEGTASVTLSNVATGHYHGVIGRLSDGDNHWRAYAYDQVHVLLQMCQGGSAVYNDIWSCAHTNGDVLSVSAVGNVVCVLKNGALVGSRTNAFNSTATKWGVYVADVYGTVDNFSFTPSR